MEIAQRIDLDCALSTLTSRQRAVLYAWAVLGISQEEIGRAVAMDQRRVSEYLARICYELRARLT